MSSKAIQIVSIIATVVGMAASLTTSWVDDKKIDEKINKKCEELLSAAKEES